MAHRWFGRHTGGNNHQRAIMRQTSSHIAAYSSWLVDRYRAALLPNVTPICTSPTLNISFPSAVGRLVEDRGNDGPIGHQRQVRPGTNVVYSDETFHDRVTSFILRPVLTVHCTTRRSQKQG